MSLSNRFGFGRRKKQEELSEAEELERLLFQPRKAPPSLSPRKAKKKDNSDFVVGALGVTLGLTCALFPWYIFFNQEKFGVREFVFESGGSGGVPDSIAYQPQRIGQPFAHADIPTMKLDFIPTATVAPGGEPPRSVAVEDQPFPADLVSFQLVHVANGRAMIQDADGLWIVQPGSRLPDASKVASIEQRDGRWVLITSLDKVLQLEE